MQRLLEKYFNQQYPSKKANISPLSGGDVAHAFTVEVGKVKYFTKVQPQPQGIAASNAEKNALEALTKHSSFVVPKIISNKVFQNQAILTLSFLEKSEPSEKDWGNFGYQLAELHKNNSDVFGWKENNFIGRLTQINTTQHNWAEFYTDCRLFPLIKVISNNTPSFPLPSSQKITTQLKSIFPTEPPALLHGDLWSGNVMMTTKGFAIYDPSIYYGHREMDIGMSLLFGGFNQRYINTYHESFPLESNWLERTELTQLYPLLVHAIMFGGSYINSCKGIILKYFC